MLIARIAAVVALVTTALLTPVSANAASDERPWPRFGGHGVEWEPYRTSGFTASAGQLCDFPLRSEPVLDEEMVATLSTFPDGAPRVQAFKGALHVRLTNLESGASTVEDLSGKALVHYFADGSYTMYLYGPVGVGFQPGDAYATGFYVLDGFHVVHTGPGRTDRRIVADAGTEHDVCEELA
jgi:hypothetical protein